MVKSKAAGKSAHRILDELLTADLKYARTAIADGVQAAQKRWIEAPVIADALMMELLKVARDSQVGSEISTHLRKLASAIEDQSPLH